MPRAARTPTGSPPSSPPCGRSSAAAECRQRFDFFAALCLESRRPTAPSPVEFISVPTLNTYRAGADERGHFGRFGGRFVAETLMPLILEVERAYGAARRDPAFQAELDYYLQHYVGRPSPLFFAERLTRHLGGAKIYLKRDELNHTGSHKINNCVGQILLARRMGKRRIIAETGAGQHGVATATV